MKTKYLNKIALFPADTRTGDFVCILYGCSVPVVLRRLSKSEEEIESDKELAKKEQLRAVRMIQRRFRESRILRIARARRRRDIAKAQLYELFTHLTRSHTHNVICSTLFVILISVLGSLDLTGYFGGLRTTVYGSLLHSFIALSKKPGHIVTTFIIIISFAVGPIISVLWMKLFKLLRAFARWLHFVKEEEFKAREPVRFYFTLVGECYVHGMMGGEAINLQNAELATNKKSGTQVNGHVGRPDEDSENEEAKPTGGRTKSQKAKKAKARAKKKQSEAEGPDIGQALPYERFQKVTFEIR
jgi:hypothetical protein